jgi:hypothetical protein
MRCYQVAQLITKSHTQVTIRDLASQWVACQLDSLFSIFLWPPYCTHAMHTAAAATSLVT